MKKELKLLLFYVAVITANLAFVYAIVKLVKYAWNH